MVQVTEQYPLSRPTIYQWINRGLIESRIVQVTGERGTGKRLINVTSLERFIHNSPTKARTAIVRRKRKAGRISAHLRWDGRKK
jgi:hypothetical protein